MFANWCYIHKHKGTMNTITIRYTLLFELDFASNYKWTKCGKCFNDRTNRQIKQCYNNGSIGYNIKGRFYSLKYLRRHLVNIKKVDSWF